jgi:sterol desaturase/sphingolipid hydroxylase (fatty acid hydroxylase superfamily)
MTGIRERVAAYRADFRERHIAAGYSGWRHLALETVVCGGLAALMLARVEHFGVVESLILPLGFVFANVVEYLVHRWAMHVLRPGLARLYRRHTGQHHRFFTIEVMTTDSSRDFAIILFPVFVMFFFLGLIATPVAVGLGLLFGPDIGLSFGVSSLGSFLFYEWLHLAAHLPPERGLGRLPFVASVRRHHSIHHDTRRMRRCNFNITVPLTDWLMGTRERDADPEP